MLSASRWAFVKRSREIGGRVGVWGGAAVASATAATIPAVHAGERHTIHVGLVGCGGRGTGAAANALSVPHGPIKLVAAGDIFPNRLEASVRNLTRQFPDRVDVPAERQFVGFDAYRQVMDALRPGDVVILTTPPAFRWPHFRYAIEKRLHVFMEKPVSVDGASTRRMIELARQSIAAGLKVGVGLMSRHCEARRQLVERIRDGALGELLVMRTYRMHGPLGAFPSKRRPANISELRYQVQRFHSFLWSGGGVYSDFYVHNIDECCWMKGAWPIRAQGLGARHFREDAVDQNFDTYAVEHTFDDGTKLLLYGRTIAGCFEQFSSFLHGSRGLATITACGAVPGRCRILAGHDESGKPVWEAVSDPPNPYQTEWDRLIDAIRNDRPFNEVESGAIASAVTAMGRMAAHTGRIIEFDHYLNHSLELAPDVDKLTEDSPAPLTPDAEGRYPVPQPGIVTDREY